MGVELLEWKRVRVEGRNCSYGVAGDGPPVVFLHGWGLSNRTYRGALKRLLREPVRLYAPAMPGFGDTDPLAHDEPTIYDYGVWVERFMDAVGIDEPAVLMGHSFGGGVAIAAATEHPDKVRALVLINSVGGSAWKEDRGVMRSMAQRPLWDWGLHFPADIRPGRQLRRVLPVILEAAVPNLLRNPKAVWDAAGLARNADLTGELEELKARKLPIVVLWGSSDEIITRASFEAMRTALGGEDCYTVEGGHSWLLADPDRFGEVITNVVHIAERARAAGGVQGVPARPELDEFTVDRSG